MIPIVVGALGTVPKRLERVLEDLKIKGRLDTDALLRSARILRLPSRTELHRCRGIEPPTTTNECPGYDIKQSDCEVLIILEIWRIRITPSLPSLPGLLWPRMVAPNRVLSMGQVELKCLLMQN